MAKKLANCCDLPNSPKILPPMPFTVQYIGNLHYTVYIVSYRKLEYGGLTKFPDIGQATELEELSVT